MAASAYCLDAGDDGRLSGARHACADRKASKTLRIRRPQEACDQPCRSLWLCGEAEVAGIIEELFATRERETGIRVSKDMPLDGGQDDLADSLVVWRNLTRHRKIEVVRSAGRARSLMGRQIGRDEPDLRKLSYRWVHHVFHHGAHASHWNSNPSRPPTNVLSFGSKSGACSEHVALDGPEEPVRVCQHDLRKRFPAMPAELENSPRHDAPAAPTSRRLSGASRQRCSRLRSTLPRFGAPPDSTIVRAHQHSAGALKKTARKRSGAAKAD